MWRQLECNHGEVLRGRSSESSDIIILEEHVESVPVETMQCKQNIIITQSEGIHIGTQIITQTNADVVKGRVLGLEFVESRYRSRLRCSVAVFVCWALVVAAALALYLVFHLLPKQTRLDLELSWPKYLWDLVKNSTRVERLACLLAVATLMLCIILIVIFTTMPAVEEAIDKAPHEWRITRQMWLATPYENNITALEYSPADLVIVGHTAGSECHKFINCAAELRNLQTWFIGSKDYDIPYNFLVGNDGRVYEGRGWGVEGAHTRGYNRCAIGIGFMGDYRAEESVHTEATDSQLNRTLMLLEEGVRLGYLTSDYHVVGAKDVKEGWASPGSNLYDAIQKWDHYEHRGIYKDRTCEQIYADRSR